MGSTFVALRAPRRGFWVNDNLLELWLRFLALHVEEPAESGSPAARIRNQWLVASRGLFSGCIPDGLAEAVSTPEGDRLVRAAIGSLQEALGAAPSHLSHGVLNLMGFTAGEFLGDVETWRLIEVGRACLALLDGEITAGPSDSALMPGSGEHPIGAAPLGADRPNELPS